MASTDRQRWAGLSPTDLQAKITNREADLQLFAQLGEDTSQLQSEIDLLRELRAGAPAACGGGGRPPAARALQKLQSRMDGLVATIAMLEGEGEDTEYLLPELSMLRAEIARLAAAPAPATAAPLASNPAAVPGPEPELGSGGGGGGGGTEEVYVHCTRCDDGSGLAGLRLARPLAGAGTCCLGRAPAPGHVDGAPAGRCGASSAEGECVMLQSVRPLEDGECVVCMSNEQGDAGVRPSPSPHGHPVGTCRVGAVFASVVCRCCCWRVEISVCVMERRHMGDCCEPRQRSICSPP